MFRAKRKVGESFLKVFGEKRDLSSFPRHGWVGEEEEEEEEAESAHTHTHTHIAERRECMGLGCTKPKSS